MKRIHKQRFLLIIIFFVLIYAALLSLSLDWRAILWDEAPHLNGGILLSRGDFGGYIREGGSFYPPLLDIIIALYFKVLGLSLFSARLVSVTFGVLSVLCVFVFTYHFYGKKNAVLASVLLASMPGFVWLCRVAMIETVLIFLFSLSLILFFFWTRTNNVKILFLAGLTLILAVLVKYQAVVAAIIMLLSLVLLFRKKVSARLGKFLVISIIIGTIISVPFIALYGYETLRSWSYVVMEGSEERVEYSNRFFLPIFYLIEMTYPYSDIHPVSLPVYILGLLGLFLWFWKRRPQDKFLLMWFFVVYVFFTLIPNKNWRYVTVVFPVLAISASDCIVFIWDKATKKVRKKIGKVISVFFIVLSVSLLIYSANDAYYWIKRDNVHIPIAEASQYIQYRLTDDEAVMVLWPSGLFSEHMVRFYFDINDSTDEKLWDYPEKPVDVYKTLFNETELIEYCEILHIKYLMLYEYGDVKFFQSELTSNSILETMLDTGSFSVAKEFGSFPHRIFILQFL